jgi:hypothetical protein
MGYRKKHTTRDELGTMRKYKGTSGKTCDIKIKEYMCGDILPRNVHILPRNVHKEHEG